MKSPTTRERLIIEMSRSMQRHGLHGTGISEVLRAADAPKGVLYHHFPDGKVGLALSAIDASVAAIENRLDHLIRTHDSPWDAIELWVESASERLEASRFEAGCPLATVALESTSMDAAVRERLADAFERIRTRVRIALEAAGTPESASAGLAALIVSAYEGGLLQSRVAGSTTVMAQSVRTLLALVLTSRIVQH